MTDEMRDAVDRIAPDDLERELCFARAAVVDGDDLSERWLALVLARTAGE